PDTDIGPVIDAEAQAALAAHVEQMRAAGATIWQRALPTPAAAGTWFPPTLIELADPGELTREVFGPVLHLVRYREDELDRLIRAINAPGYGLTHGIQTRIDETVAFICARIRAGNIYVNRNIVGAVVGVQPFGGDGLSGTGPKAGGPHYLRRLVRGSDPITAAALNMPMVLPGPTGETNTLALLPRGRVACIATDPLALKAQVQLALALGNTVLLPASPFGRLAAARGGGNCEVAADPLAMHPDAVLFDGSGSDARAIRLRLAAQDGPLLPLIIARHGAYDVARLTCERTLTINTTASGGNATLLSLTETTL
ncbi:MAG: aldehyde dehydrogenase family protein, partial [Casimicrobiaceae bacterium]